MVVYDKEKANINANLSIFKAIAQYGNKCEISLILDKIPSTVYGYYCGGVFFVPIKHYYMLLNEEDGIYKYDFIYRFPFEI